MDRRRGRNQEREESFQAVTRTPLAVEEEEDAEEGISCNAAFSVASLSQQIPRLNMINCNKASVKLILPD